MSVAPGDCHEAAIFLDRHLGLDMTSIVWRIAQPDDPGCRRRRVRSQVSHGGGHQEASGTVNVAHGASLHGNHTVNSADLKKNGGPLSVTPSTTSAADVAHHQQHALVNNDLWPVSF